MIARCSSCVVRVCVVLFPFYLYTYLCLFVCLFVIACVCLFVCLFVCVVCLCVCLPVCLFVVVVRCALLVFWGVVLCFFSLWFVVRCSLFCVCRSLFSDRCVFVVV